jgi:SanA protein
MGPTSSAGAQAKRRSGLRIFRLLLILGTVAFICGNLWIALRARGRVFATIETLPPNDVGLVLGTSARGPTGWENPFFANRIAAAAELYRAGKVKHLVLSGDNRRVENDEPTDMRNALAKHGVPESATTLDYAGFRTLDSFARAKEVFGVTKLTIITDDFHVERALLLARHYGIDAIAFPSKPVPFRWSKKTRLREIGARCKALLDLYVLRTKPHFLGPRVTLPLESAPSGS